MIVVVISPLAWYSLLSFMQTWDRFFSSHAPHLACVQSTATLLDDRGYRYSSSIKETYQTVKIFRRILIMVQVISNQGKRQTWELKHFYLSTLESCFYILYPSPGWFNSRWPLAFLAMSLYAQIVPLYQRGGEISIHGDIQNPSGCGPGQLH